LPVGFQLASKYCSVFSHNLLHTDYTSELLKAFVKREKVRSWAIGKFSRWKTFPASINDTFENKEFHYNGHLEAAAGSYHFGGKMVVALTVAK